MSVLTRQQRKRRQVPLMASFLLVWVGQVIVFQDFLHLALLGLIVLLWAAAIPQLLRDANRAQRFLNRHEVHFPEDPADGNDKDG